MGLLLDVDLRAANLPPKEVGGLLWSPNLLLDEGHGSFMGFYDWLRKRSFPKRILGVRFWAHNPAYLPKEILEKRRYVSVLHQKNAFEIWFGSERDCEAGLSGDQSLGFNRLLISSDNSQAALVIDMNDLSPDEIHSIESALKFEEASWIPE